VGLSLCLLTDFAGVTMDSFLDVRTLSFMTGIVSFIMFACMLYVSLTRKTYRGFKTWTIASFVSFVGMLLISMRNFLPDFITIVIANTFIGGHYALLFTGMARFANIATEYLQSIIVISLFFVLFILFTFFFPSVNARSSVISITAAYFFLKGTFIIHLHIPKTLKFKNHLLTLVFLSQSAFFLFRCIGTLFFEENFTDYLNAPSFHVISLIVFISGGIFSVLGVIILNSQRIESDLKEAVSQVKELKGIIPICSSCKKIRNDKGYWQNLENYIQEHSDADFSHSICPDCAKDLYKDL